MGTIAKGEITLVSVNDAYTVSVTPASCTIRADFDGSNPDLTNAKGVISIKRGAKTVPFHVSESRISTSGRVKYQIGSNLSIPFNIDFLPPDALEGTVNFDIVTDDGFDYKTTVGFAFTIVREATMLDWIQDWEGGKTKIGDSYIMTPKVFIGKKEDACRLVEFESVDSYEEGYEWVKDVLTGVYIGPDLLNSQKNGIGLYGYLQGKEIFHLNADGGLIGGWMFSEAGLRSSNGIVNILSTGSIFAKNPESATEYWGVYADGHATFANGNVKFLANGSAEYAGKITSKSGSIGGWCIGPDQLYSRRIILDTKVGYIGINASQIQYLEDVTGNLIFPDAPEAGIKMWYSSANDFGFAAWASGCKIFQLGSINKIAGWNFNDQAIWSGSDAPALFQGSFTSDSGALTVAPNGIRSIKWYVDANGTAQFVGGNVKFNTEYAEMFGWKMRDTRFSSNHVALVADPAYSGLYISATNLTDVNAEILSDTITSSGGCMVRADSSKSILGAYNTDGDVVFLLQSHGYNKIAEWYFDSDNIWVGSENIDAATKLTPKPNQMILSPALGLIGHLWRLSGDGSGCIAGGHISWDTNGNVTIDSTVKISWSSVTGADGVMDKGTYIDANGVFTGKVDASKITTGILSANRIDADSLLSVANKWALKQDGSGYLASKRISWDVNGNVTIDSTVKISWSSVTGTDGVMTKSTYIDANGIFTGNIDASKITTGTLSANRIDADSLLSVANKWALKQDGSGSLAAGHISWDTNGNVTIDSTVKISWSNVTGTDGVMTKGTYIDANGIFTGKIDASKITTGTLSANRIDADSLLSVAGKWSLKQDGSGSLAAGHISWDTNGNVTIDSTVKISWSSVTGTDGVMTKSTYIDANGIFTGNIDASKITTGTLNANRIDANSLLSVAGKWSLKQDGSGSLAAGHISWDTNGNVTIDSTVKISWSSVTGADGVMTKSTYIDANGIFTGKIDASKITTGTLSASRIDADSLLSVANKWALKQDGSGYLASKHISWDVNGNLEVEGNMKISVLKYIVKNSDELANGPINCGFIPAFYGGAQSYTLPHLQSGEWRVIKLLGVAETRSGGGLTLAVEDNEHDRIVCGTDHTKEQYTNYFFGSEYADGVGYFELLGRGFSDATYWYIIPLYIPQFNIT